MKELTHTVGRYRVTGEYEPVKIEFDDSEGIHSENLGRLELTAARAVLAHAESIVGDELKFARKAIGLSQVELGALLDVTNETVSRWETGAEPIRRVTQLVLLLLVDHTLRNGEHQPLPGAGPNDPIPMRVR